MVPKEGAAANPSIRRGRMGQTAGFQAIGSMR